MNLRVNLPSDEELTSWVDRLRLAVKVRVFLDDELRTNLLSEGCCDSEAGEG